MSQTLPKTVNFEEFVLWLPENSGVRYELHKGNITEMAQPAGEHEEIKDSIKEVSQKVDSLEKRIDERFDKMATWFGERPEVHQDYPTYTYRTGTHLTKRRLHQ